MQYYKPDDPQLWVGDCMPFYHAGLFHFYYLLDEGHHQALGGLGGHQWAHATSPDLVTWTHHPLALPITQAGEVSICTGSVFHHGDTFYAFHAVRRPDWTQRLGIATSADGRDGVARAVEPCAHDNAAIGIDRRDLQAMIGRDDRRQIHFTLQIATRGKDGAALVEGHIAHWRAFDGGGRAFFYLNQIAIFPRPHLDG